MPEHKDTNPASDRNEAKRDAKGGFSETEKRDMAKKLGEGTARKAGEISIDREEKIKQIVNEGENPSNTPPSSLPSSSPSPKPETDRKERGNKRDK